MRAQVVPDLPHRGDCTRIHGSSGPGARAVRLHGVPAVNPCKSLGHLATIGIFDANEENLGRGALATHREIPKQMPQLQAAPKSACHLAKFFQPSCDQVRQRCFHYQIFNLNGGLNLFCEEFDEMLEFGLYSIDH